MDFRAVQERLRQAMEEVQEEIEREKDDEAHQILLVSIETDLMALKRKIRGYELYTKKPRS